MSAFNFSAFSNVWSEFKGQISRALNKDGDVMEGDLKIGTNKIKDSQGNDAIEFDHINKSVRLYGQLPTQTESGSVVLDFSNLEKGSVVEVEIPYGKSRGMLYWYNASATESHHPYTRYFDVYMFSNLKQSFIHLSSGYDWDVGSITELYDYSNDRYSVFEDIYIENNHIYFIIKNPGSKTLTMTYQVY